MAKQKITRTCYVLIIRVNKNPFDVIYHIYSGPEETRRIIYVMKCETKSPEKVMRGRRMGLKYTHFKRIIPSLGTLM